MSEIRKLLESLDAIEEVSFGDMAPDSAFGDNEDSSANLRYHLEQALVAAKELGNDKMIRPIERALRTASFGEEISEKEAGMSDKERKAYNRKHGSNLKRAQPGGGKRKTSYCARSKGQMDMHNISCRKTPDKEICKARRDWDC